MPKMTVEEIAAGFPPGPSPEKGTPRVEEQRSPCSEAKEIRVLRLGEVGADSAILILREEGGDQRLLIFIAQREAEEIAHALSADHRPRPMTHDLLTTVITKMGGQVEEVLVSELKDCCFHALITIRTRDGPLKIDSRPSDAIALAVRVDASIHCEQSVLEEAGQRWSRNWEWDPKRRPASTLWSTSSVHA